jgi:hypothetical protein
LFKLPGIPLPLHAGLLAHVPPALSSLFRCSFMDAAHDNFG